MKSILQNIVLLSSILLIASCDSGRDGGVGDIGVTPPVPSNGITGSAVKGIISGASITVTNASGASVAVASGGTTSTSGTYSLVFTEAAIAAGITGPLTVVINAGGQTAVCDYDNPASATDDCGTGIAFGTTYTLPNPFVLRGTIASIPADTATSDPVVVVHVSPASDLATALAETSAAGSALTAADVTAANQQILGLIQTMTGVDMSGFDLVDIPLYNLASLSATAKAAPDASYAMMAFAAAIIGDIDAGATTVAAVIARLKTQLTVDAATGNLTATGTNLGRLTSAVARSLAKVNSQLAAAGIPRGALTAAQTTATANAALYTAFGSTAVKVPPAAVPGSETAVNLTKKFVGELSSVISSIQASTGAENSLSSAPTELLATQLRAAETLTRGPATTAWAQLQAKLIAAEASIDNGGSTTNGVETTNDDNVTFVAAKDSTGKLTITNATSTWSNSTNGSKVTLTIASATRTPDSALSATGVSLVTTQTVTPDAGGTPTTSTKQTFTGTASATFAAESGDIGLKSLTLNGNLSAGTTTTTNFGLAVSLTSLAGVTSGDSNGGNVTGKYSLTISFNQTGNDALSVKFSGDIGVDPGSYLITAGDQGETVMGTLSRSGNTDTVTLTNAVVTLTVIIDRSNGPGVLSSGKFTVAGAQTATINKNGVVTYNDGSIQSLPAGAFD